MHCSHYSSMVLPRHAIFWIFVPLCLRHGLFMSYSCDLFFSIIFSFITINHIIWLTQKNPKQIRPFCPYSKNDAWLNSSARKNILVQPTSSSRFWFVAFIETLLFFLFLHLLLFLKMISATVRTWCLLIAAILKRTLISFEILFTSVWRQNSTYALILKLLLKCERNYV